MPTFIPLVKRTLKCDQLSDTSIFLENARIPDGKTSFFLLEYYIQPSIYYKTFQSNISNIPTLLFLKITYKFVFPSTSAGGTVIA